MDHPTIGVIAEGLLCRIIGVVKPAKVVFPVEDGRAELIKCVSSPGLYMVDNVEPGSCGYFLSRRQSLRVNGPSAVRTVVEMKNPPPNKVRSSVITGVYFCQYLRND